MVGESNKNVLLIQIDASSFAEFEISEFDISRVDCSVCTTTSVQSDIMPFPIGQFSLMDIRVQH